jgi:hypothetical protein
VSRLAALIVLLMPLLASAKEAVGTSIGSSGDSGPPRRYESRQLFAFEIKFSPYSPKLDQSAGLRAGETPFADLFNPQLDDDGNSTKGQQPPYRLLTTIEFDVQFLRRPWGNLGVGITTGFYRRTTHGFELNADGSACRVPYCTRSGDEVALNVLPLSALFVYRFDLLANRYHVPLVPYFKIGLAYYVWWMENGNGVSQKPESAYGGSFGWVLNPGLALQLDFIERGVARTLDGELGINHTYLFCELHYADVDGFRANDKLNLSDTTFNAGFAFEF